MKFFGLCFVAMLVAGASASVDTYSNTNYGYATKGGAIQQQGVKGQAAKGVMKTFVRPQPVLSKTRYPTKGLVQPAYEQKIEQTQQVEEQTQQVQQQVEEQVVQQKVEQVQQKFEQMPEAKVKKVGITKWEQKIEQVPVQQVQVTRTKITPNAYVPRKNLKPLIQKIEQQITQQEEDRTQQQVQQAEEPFHQQVQQQVEQKVLSQRPAYTQTRRILKPHKKIEENVRQVPQSFDGNWE